MRHASFVSLGCLELAYCVVENCFQKSDLSVTLYLFAESKLNFCFKSQTDLGGGNTALDVELYVYDASLRLLVL